MPNNTIYRRRVLAAVAIAGTLAGCNRTDSKKQPDVLHVTPDGDDANTGTEAAPLSSVQEGLRRAQPGNTVQLHPGEYREIVRTTRDGELDRPTH